MQLQVCLCPACIDLSVIQPYYTVFLCMKQIYINTIFYEVKAVFANILHYHTSISNCKVPEEVLTMVNHKENENKIIKSK